MYPTQAQDLSILAPDEVYCIYICIEMSLPAGMAYLWPTFAYLWPTFAYLCLPLPTFAYLCLPGRHHFFLPSIAYPSIAYPPTIAYPIIFLPFGLPFGLPSVFAYLLAYLLAYLHFEKKMKNFPAFEPTFGLPLAYLWPILT